jgi:polar amino acid transport system substrate-binding protein
VKIFTLGFAIGAAILLSIGAVTAQQRVVKVAYGVNSPPTQFIDSTKNFAPSGAAVELMMAVAKDAGFTVEFHPTIVADVAAGLNAKIFDASVGVQFTQIIRDLGLDFSDPIWLNTEWPAVKKTDTKPYKSFDDFKGEVVATSNAGYRDALQKSGLMKEVKYFANAPDAYASVLSGESKAVFGLAVNLTIQLKDYPDLKRVEGYQPRVPTPAGFGFRKTDTDLIAQINKSLAKLKTDGTVKTIFAKYDIDFALAP